MRRKQYDDLVLEVAEELELTSREGDFMRVLERILSASVAGAQPQVIWSIAQLDRKVEGQRMALRAGDQVEIGISIPVEAVLAGRDVMPQDVVDLFAGDKGPRRIRLEMGPSGKLYFHLTQQYLYDDKLRDRHLAISGMFKLFAPDDPKAKYIGEDKKPAGSSSNTNP
jgi:hypothetical protein